MYDLIIIGAGPAGATLARLLGAKRSVLLLESRGPDDDGKRPEKCCGGLLAPDAQTQLRRMGLALPAFVCDSGQPLRVKALDLVSGDARHYPRAYINLDRPAFERWLLSLLPSGVTFLPGRRCTGIRPAPGGGWQVTAQGPEDARVYTGRLLAGAEGASSLVRRTLDPSRDPKRFYLALQDSFRLKDIGNNAGFLSTEYTAFFHPELTDFYGWVIPKQDRVLLGAALPLRGRNNAAKRMRTARDALRRHGYDFPEPDGKTPFSRRACLVMRPRPRDIFCGRNGAFCIGEAAGWISPSSAEGFSYAFASAEALAGAILAEGGPNAILRAYGRNSLPLRANILWKRVKSAVMYTPGLRRLVMRSGLAASPRGR